MNQGQSGLFLVEAMRLIELKRKADKSIAVTIVLSLLCWPVAWWYVGGALWGVGGIVLCFALAIVLGGDAAIYAGGLLGIGSAIIWVMSIQRAQREYEELAARMGKTAPP